MANLLLHVTCTRQHKSKGRSTPLTALHPDPSAMGFDDVFHNRQSQACSAFAGLTRAAEEFIEHTRYILSRDPVPIIADRKLHPTIAAVFNGQLDATIFRGVSQRV